jgi:hypothetical protein
MSARRRRQHQVALDIGGAALVGAAALLLFKFLQQLTAWALG